MIDWLPFVLSLCLCASTFQAQGDQSSSNVKTVVPQPTKPDEKRAGRTDSGSTHGPIDILSDTGGVDVHPYLNRILPLLRENWYRRVPQSARAPVMKKGKVTIAFRILKDGTITDVVYKNSSGDSVLDRAAYDGIVESNPLPSIGSDFACKSLALQIHFYYNEEPAAPSIPKDPLVPCVTAKIQMVGEVGITLSPVSAQVVAGGKQQLLAVVKGELNSGVNWKLSGSGCSGATCGDISPEGVYTAPSSIPDPPSVIVTAVLGTAPSQTATSTITIVPRR